MDPQQRLLLECTEEALAAARLSVQGAVTGTSLLSSYAAGMSALGLNSGTGNHPLPCLFWKQKD